jgi:hypothetical protein
MPKATLHAGVPGAPDVEVFNENLRPLINAERSVLQGWAVDGDCHFSLPDLVLAPGGPAQAMQKVSLNEANCQMVIEVGTPVRPVGLTQEEGGISHDDEPMPEGDFKEEETASRLSSGCGSAYHLVWWEDIVTQDVNKVRPEVDFCWNGSCATYGGGNVHYWWLILTGWGRGNYSSTYSNPCAFAKVTGNAVYVNYAFCGNIPWVEVHYNSINIYGFYNGVISGTLSSTWVEGPGLCPPLDWYRESNWQ